MQKRVHEEKSTSSQTSVRSEDTDLETSVPTKDPTELKDDMDDLLDEIDRVLGENEAELLDLAVNYRQEGGE